TKDLYELKNGIRINFAQVVGGAVLLIGLFFTRRNLTIAQEGQITDRFTKAVNQLGEYGPENLAIRLGGIYALEMIARASGRDYWSIIEVLTAYVREKAPRKEESPKENDSPDKTQLPEEDQPPPKLEADIQASLTVIGRLTRTFGNGETQRLDLSY